jgi:hypothetical protein
MIQGFNSGGFVKAMRYFDRGGFAPKGTDTIPAMLSPGEFVVNARSTRKFFSQLQSINAGHQPVFRANGGSVTNNNVGDVSIAINGAQQPKLVGREVARALFREKRTRHDSLSRRPALFSGRDSFQFNAAASR